MTYLVIFNGRQIHQEKIRTNTWLEFIQALDELVFRMREPPDMIYLISLKD